MFNRRLKTFLILVLLVGAAFTLRLAQLQVVQAERYAKDAEHALYLPTRYIASVRGRILDRYGRLLASDEPSWDVCMHYQALKGDEDYIEQIAAQWRRQHRLTPYAQLEKDEEKRRYEATVAKKIEDSYALVAELSGEPLDEIQKSRDHILEHVAGIQRSLIRRKGYYDVPEETRMVHPLARGLSDQDAVRARMALAEFDWLTVQASTRRVYRDALPLGHVMGRLGQVTEEAIRTDPFRGEKLREYKAWEMFGVAGAEHLCERMLRGQRGMIELDIDGEEIGRVQPIDGADARLTIDAELQRQIYEMLAATCAKYPLTTGGAAVVLHVPTRQILALVSYPAFEPNLFRKDYATLRDDTRWRPTLFRAVAGVYPPGSAVKPATLATALALNLITPETRLDCNGYLHNPEGRFKCWIYNKFGTSHNASGYPNGLNAEEALKVSCNCYFYQLGERIHGDRLCQWFRQFWIGPPPPPGMVAGTGLIEERPGVLPTAEWLWEHERRPMRPGDSRNFAIGQGELGLTPLEVANLMATVASGEFRWPTLVANDGRERPAWDLGIRPEHWRTVRNGLYRVVNESHGTAYNHARMDEITVAGKTGSAQCSRIVLDRRYVVEMPDGTRTKIVAKNRADLEKQLARTPNAKVLSSRPYHLWPPLRTPTGKSVDCAHAWFAGFVPGDPGAKPQYAIAVLVEFGESGGLKAAPVAKQIIHALIESPHGYLKAKTPAEPR